VIGHVISGWGAARPVVSVEHPFEVLRRVISKELKETALELLVLGWVAVVAVVEVVAVSLRWDLSDLKQHSCTGAAALRWAR